MGRTPSLVLSMFRHSYLVSFCLRYPLMKYISYLNLNYFSEGERGVQMNVEGCIVLLYVFNQPIPARIKFRVGGVN